MDETHEICLDMSGEPYVWDYLRGGGGGGGGGEYN